jgi:hypothetical protein
MVHGAHPKGNVKGEVAVLEASEEDEVEVDGPTGDGLGDEDVLEAIERDEESLAAERRPAAPAFELDAQAFKSGDALCALCRTIQPSSTILKHLALDTRARVRSIAESLRPARG